MSGGVVTFLVSSVLGAFVGAIAGDLWGRSRGARLPTRRLLAVLAGAAVFSAVGLGGWHQGEQRRLERSDTSLQVMLDVLSAGEQSWTPTSFARPGQVVEYRLRVKNDGPGRADGLVLGVNAADYQTFVCGSLKLFNGNHPIGTLITADHDSGCAGKALILGGIGVGDYLPDAAAYVIWKMRLDPVGRYAKLGPYELTTVGIGRVPGKTNEVYNTARLQVEVG